MIYDMNFFSWRAHTNSYIISPLAVSYTRFVISSLVRITSGYLFLVNVLVVLIQAKEVIIIFYDILALQFIQKLDDVGFAVSKMGVLGKHVERATMQPCLNITFNREKDGHLKRRTRIFLKALYGVNFILFMFVMISISLKQTSGYYQCKSITMTFGNDIWKSAIVQWPEDSGQYPPGLKERLVLAYDYFNGVYVKSESRTYNGRPVYIEMKKSDRTPFDTETPKTNPYHHDGSQEYGIDAVKPVRGSLIV